MNLIHFGPVLHFRGNVKEKQGINQEKNVMMMNIMIEIIINSSLINADRTIIRSFCYSQHYNTAERGKAVHQQKYEIEKTSSKSLAAKNS